MKPYDWIAPTAEQRQAWAHTVPLIEPDHCEWEHRGMQCCVLRHTTLGHWCGYVLIPQDMLEQINLDDIKMHGGMTFDRIHKGDLWIGFDCGHSWDISPHTKARYAPDAYYRDFAYVTKQVRGIVDQIMAERMIDAALGGL